MVSDKLSVLSANPTRSKTEEIILKFYLSCLSWDPNLGLRMVAELLIDLGFTSKPHKLELKDQVNLFPFFIDLEVYEAGGGEI